MLDSVLALLSHANLDLVYSLCGTLINFTIDSEYKEALVERGGVQRLMEVMERVVTSAQVSETEVRGAGGAAARAGRGGAPGRARA